eukprot:8902953-Pyramimonas_sp.AAC.1
MGKAQRNVGKLLQMDSGIRGGEGGEETKEKDENEDQTLLSPSNRSPCDVKEEDPQPSAPAP